MISLAKFLLFTINPLPKLFDVTGGSKCGGGTITLGLSGSEVGTVYQLYHSNSPVGVPVMGTGMAISFGSSSRVGTYTVKVTNSYGCRRLMAGQSTLGSPLMYSVTGGSVCGEIGVRIGLSGSDVGVKYHLYNGKMLVGDAIVGTGTAISFVVQGLPGTYTVEATTPAGCKNTMSGTATYYALPIVYTVAGGAQCEQKMVKAGLSGSENNLIYNLMLNNVVVDSKKGTGGEISFNPQKVDGIYTVTAITSVGGCTRTMNGNASVNINCSSVTTTNTATRAEVSEILSVYPNPTTGQFTVYLKNYQALKAEVTVLSSNGSLIEQKQVQLFKGSQTVLFNLQDKASGTYIVKVVSENGVQTAKVLIQR